MEKLLIDEKVNFANLTNDYVFKKIMSIPKLAKDFINSYLEYCGSSLHVKDVTSTSQKFIQNNKINLHDYYLDIFVVLSNNEIFNIEMYNDFGIEQCKKSVTYATMLYSQQLKKEDTFGCSHKVTSLNLITGNFNNNNEFVNSYQFKNEFTSNILLDDLIEIVLLRLDKVPTFSYTLCKQRFIQWSKFIVAKSYEEMEIIGNGDEIFMSTIEIIKDFCNDPDYIRIARNDNSRWIDVANNAQAKGISIGKEQGIDIGKAEIIQNFSKSMSTKEIANKLNMPFNEVKKYINMVL